MKRSNPLRRTPMKRGDKPLRRVPLKRTAPLDGAAGPLRGSGLKRGSGPSRKPTARLRARQDTTARAKQALIDIFGPTCQAVALHPSGQRVLCTRGGQDYHHRVEVSRGGALLDGLTYEHVTMLCRIHHGEAHMMVPGLGHSDRRPLIIKGYVQVNAQGAAVYTGPDEVLTRLFPPQ